MSQEGSGASAHTLAGGVFWIGTIRWSAQLLNWLSTLVVIRLLTPQDYGIVGMALVWIGLASVLAEFGLGTALVALPSLNEREAAQANSLAMLLAAGMALLSMLGAGVVAGFFQVPALIPVLRVLSLGFLVEGLRIVPMACLARRLAYRTMAGIDFARSVATAGFVVGLAALGLGYWSLVLGNLAGQLVAAGWVMTRHRVPWARPVAADLKTALRYSRHILVNRAAWQGYINADFLVVGRLFGAQLLGFYTVAWNLASLPGEKLGNVLSAATAPFFSSIQHDRPALRHFFLRTTEALTVVLHPLLIGFLLVADLAVPLVLGERWAPAVPPLRILVAYASLQSIMIPVSQILNVTGNTRTGMWSSLIALVILVPAFVIGGYVAGINGVALAWLSAFPLINALPMGTALRALDISIGQYFGAWRRSAEGVLAMAAAVGLARGLLHRYLVPMPWLELVVAVAAGAVGYLGLLLSRHPALLADARVLLRRPRPPG